MGGWKREKGICKTFKYLANRLQCFLMQNVFFPHNVTTMGYSRKFVYSRSTNVRSKGILKVKNELAHYSFLNIAPGCRGNPLWK